jgi:hypothetical protein
MGRAKKYAEVALKAAAVMLPTTKSQTIKLQLIRSVLQYEQHREGRADARRAERLRLNESKEITQLRIKVKELTAQSGQTASAKDKEIEELKSQLGEANKNAETLRSEYRRLKDTKDEEVLKSSEIQETLSVTNEVLKVIACAVPEEKQIGCAANLFGKFRSKNKKALDHAFTSMGLSLTMWIGWEKKYGTDYDQMLDLVLDKEKSNGELRALLRLKLSEIGMDCVDAINSAFAYRDLKIDFEALKKHTHPYILFTERQEYPLLIKNTIPKHRMPRVTQESLRKAGELADLKVRLEWLIVVDKLLEKEPDIETQLMQLQIATRDLLERESRSNTK